MKRYGCRNPKKRASTRGSTALAKISSPPREPGFLHALGAPLVAAGRDLRELLALFAQTLYWCVRGRREKGDVIAQMYSLGNRSWFFLSVSMGFIGMILVFQAGAQAAKVVPDFSLLGPFYIKLLVRDLAASIGAMPLATRVGAGIAAEIGTMVVTEQTDALRMCSAEPVDYLVVPRFLASIVMTTVLLVWAAFVALIAGMQRTIPRFLAVGDRCSEIRSKLAPDRQVFFNDNLRAYSYTMAALSRALLEFLSAYQQQANPTALREHLEQAEQAVESAQRYLHETEHGVFATWYRDAEPMARTVQLDAWKSTLRALRQTAPGGKKP